MIKCTALFNVEWTDGQHVHGDVNVPVVATYNPSILKSVHSRQKELANLAEMQFRFKKQYGPKGLLFGKCRIKMRQGSYFEMQL